MGTACGASNAALCYDVYFADLACFVSGAYGESGTGEGLARRRHPAEGNNEPSLGRLSAWRDRGDVRHPKLEWRTRWEEH